MVEQRHLGYRPDIDGLRALAVSSVVAFHAFPNLLRGGFVGVDIFFVISGFLISNIVFLNLEQQRFSFSQFYARRIKRIFPALLLVLISCLVAGRILLLADEYKLLGKHVAAGITFVSNIVLWTESGYFDKAAELKPLLHLWSLGIEEQFYLLWPPVVVLTWRRKSLFSIVLLALLLISFGINIFEVGQNPVATFYLPFSRMWELLVGCSLAYMTSRWKTTTNLLEGNLCSVVGFFLICFALFGLTKDSRFPGWAALLPTVGAFLLIAAGPAAWLNRNLLSIPAVVFVGLISYPLYLWHWPLLSFARIVLSKEPDPATVILIVEAAVLLAWLTYRIIEKPVRFSKSLRVPVALAGTGILAGACGYYVNATNGAAGPSRVISQAKTTHSSAASTDSAASAVANSAVTITTSAESGQPKLKTVEDPAHLEEVSVTPTEGRSQISVATPAEIYARQQQQFLWIENGDNSTPACLGQFLIEPTGHDDKCEIQDGKRQPTVALIGDSHANAMYLGFAKYYATRGDNLVNFGRGGCLPFWGVNTEYKGGSGTDCEKFMNRFLDYALTSPTIHTVVLAAFGDDYIDNGDRPIVSSAELDNKASSQVYERELRSTIGRFLVANKKVIVVMDYPRLLFDPHACLARPAAGAPAKAKCATPQSEVDARMKPYRRLMYKVLASTPGASYVDVTNAYCDGTDCWAMKNDVLLFRDENHLSHDGSLYFAPYIKILKAGPTQELMAKQRALGPAPSSSQPQPSHVSVAPSVGTGQSQVFKIVASGSRGASRTKAVWLLVNNVLHGGGACYVEYDRVSNQIRLADDSIAWQAPSKVGSGSPLTNSQCTVNTAESSASFDTDQVTLNLSLTFSPKFRGAKTIYARAFDDDGLRSGWEYAGTWGVR